MSLVASPSLCVCTHIQEDEEGFFVPTSQLQEDGEDYKIYDSRTRCFCDLGGGSGVKLKTHLVRRASPVKFNLACAATLAARIPSLKLVRCVTSSSPVKCLHYGRAASRLRREILDLEAKIARMRKRYERLNRKARSNK
ncbi:hypothetical protein B0H10DRAFT_1961608 [Mycena sp. CBHHK59/15]|nr:hypothetical protein B0H10DRAFT_1961608 [Mycena sp. CBHHK59/15]